MTAADSSPKKQSIGVRFALFLLGAVVNYLLISTPLAYLKHHHPGMPEALKVALSVSVSAAFFFFWNYFVNFRTGSRKRDALARYLIAAGSLLALQYLVLWLLNGADKHPFVHLVININRDVVATQLCLGGFKFLIYHYWAFPAHKEPSR